MWPWLIDYVKKQFTEKWQFIHDLLASSTQMKSRVKFLSLQNISRAWFTPQCYPHIHLFVAVRYKINVIRHIFISYFWSCTFRSHSLTKTAYPSVNSMMLYAPIQWMVVCFVVCPENGGRGGGLFNAVGLTVTFSAKKEAGFIIIEIKSSQSRGQTM